MSSSIRSALFCAACAGLVAGVAAQTPRDNDSTRQSMDNNASDHVVTVSGCLLQEKDVPGRDPSVVERMGMGEDFILTNARMSNAPNASMPASSGQSTPGASTPGTPSTVTPGNATPGSTPESSNPGAATPGRSSSSGGSMASGASGSSSSSGAMSQSAGRSGASQMRQMGAMYKVTGIDDDRLRTLVNQEVEIRGEVDADQMSRLGTAGAAPTTRSTAGRASDDAGTATGATASPNGGSGTIGSNAGGATNDNTNVNNDLPEIDAQSIRMIGSTCPTTTGR